MGVVYRARQTLLNQIVALKVLPTSHLADPEAVLRFRREMRSIGGLNHPNIVRAYNAGEDRGTQFLATEFVDGTTLHQLVAEQGTLTVPAACELARQAAVGLQSIHESGLVHRDIKPANLMLARGGIIKILDLGLAGLHVAGLTQEWHGGRLLGTVDYMAPEQWVDPDAVDIRADIYSLGCTLFYLLTGQAPSAVDAPAMRRKKPTANAAASVIRLSEIRDDCPEDLNLVLESMLAEDADDRLDTPGEVAEALAPFAEPQEVNASLAASTRGLDQRRNGVSPRGRGSAIADLDQGGRPSNPWLDSADQDGESEPRRPFRRIRNAGWVTAALLGGFIAVWLLSQSSEPDPIAPDHSVGADSVQSVLLASEVCALPGLNGRWWFDETPWLLPCVRQAIANELTADILSAEGPVRGASENSPLLDPNTGTVQDWLLQMVSTTRGNLTASQQALLDDLLGISQEDLVDTQLAARLHASLTRFSRDLGESATWAPVDLHTRAVLEHKVAMITNDRDLAEQAAKSYESAATVYAQTGAVTFSLRARCLVDWGQLHAQVLRKGSDAQRLFREARALPDVPLLLQAEAWVDEGIANAAANKYSEAEDALTHAQRLFQDSTLALSNHPFVAHVHERYAWILMDQWDVQEANRHFKEARNIRFDNHWKSQNDFAQIFVFHNDHGQAMAERYCGDERIARAQYDLVIGEIEKALAKAEAEADRPGMQRFRRELRERLSNSRERRADCELYQGAGSDGSVDLKEAARLYALARDKADDPAVRAAMSCKRAIVLALDGQVAEAELELQQHQSAGQIVIGVQEERIQLLRKVTEAVLKLKKPDLEAGISALRALLKALDFGSDHPDHLRRETLELHLFAAELLTATELEETSLQSAAVTDAAYLERLVAGIPHRDQMLTYLRRYYDLAIKAVAQSDPERAATNILASRGQHPVTDATLVLFHFGPHSGRAIVRPGERPSVCFTLDFGREDIQQTATAVNPHLALALPDALVEFIIREQGTGRTVVLSWADGKCWARPEAALAAKDWPFGRQLDIGSFQTPAD